MTQAFPLHWPMGFARTQGRRSSQFRTGFDGAHTNVMKSLRSFAQDSGKDVQNVIVSSNVTMMQSDPKDGGVAVYFRWDNTDCCIAVDRYLSVRENLQAIHHVIEAERTKLRHGGLNIVRTSFRGYAALPPPKGPDGQLLPPWRHQLGVPECADLNTAEQAYRNAVKEHHPDKGGDPAKFNLMTDAIRQARDEFKA